MTNAFARRRIGHTVFEMLMLFSITQFGARSKDAGMPSGSGIVRLPVVDKQDIRFVRLTVDGRIFQNRIANITQDNLGFLWLGGSAGLYRYDGYNLIPYLHERGQPNSVSDDLIKAIYKDRSGILWIGTSRGLDKLDPSRDVFKHYRHAPGDPKSLSDDRVQAVYQDRGGAIWVGTEKGVDRLDPASGTFRNYRHNPADPGSLSGNTVIAVTEDRQGSLWVGTSAGLNRLDRSTGKFSRFLHDPANPESLGGNYVSFLQEDRTGVLWVGSSFGNGLSARDPRTGVFTRYSFRSVDPKSDSVVGLAAVHEDRDGSLWLATINSGLLKLDPDRKRFLRYSKDAADPNSLSHNTIGTIFEDREGTIWVGTPNGPARFQQKASGFSNYKHQASNSNSLDDNMIWSLQADREGVLWIGSESGLNRLDRRTGQFTLFRHDPRRIDSISYDKVAAIREDRVGTLWLGTYGGGLNRFDRATGRFFAYRHDGQDPGSLSSDNILCLLVDRKGTLWVGTQGGGLNRFDRETGRFTVYRHDPKDPRSLSNESVLTMHEDQSGILWLGTHEGLNRFDPQTKGITVYRHNAEDLHSLSDNKVNVIWEDRRGTLWVGTQNGLNQMDRGNGTFAAFTAKDGLPGNMILSIREDRRGNLWVATVSGLSRLDPSAKTFRNYFESDGLPADRLSPYGPEGSFQMENGEIAFGSSDGVTIFRPDLLAGNPYVPPVVLTDFLLFNKPVDRKANSPIREPIWALHSLTLTPDQDVFSLEFSALSYAAPERNRYQYRLANFETNWNQADSRRRLATYTNIPPGKYVFQLQGSNNDGVWNPRITSLEITVLPPWWATWWFRTIAGLTLAGAILAVHRYRLRGLRRAGIRLEKQVAERTRQLEIAKEAAEQANRAKSTFLANMSHELRTPLNAILGFSSLDLDSPDLPDRRRRNLEIVNRSGEYLLSLIDDVLDTAKIEAGHVTVVNAAFDVVSLMHDNVEMMRGRAIGKGLELILKCSPSVPRFIRSDAGKLRQVLINLVGNAVKFTGLGAITVRLDAMPIDDNAWLVLNLEVEDTGVGIAPEDQARVFDAFVQGGDIPAQKGTGLGLTITRQFVQMMGGTIGVESAPGKGSKFRVELPVERVDESEMTAAKEERGQLSAVAAGQPDFRILIVEDGQENRQLLQEILEGAGFQVQVAGDGEEGVEKFRGWKPHLIWMDVRLPGMGGLEATRVIRGMDGGDRVKIVALTASVFTHQREEVLAAGMDDFVRKPYRRAEIFDCMARHLDVRYVYRPAPSPAPSQAAATPETVAMWQPQLALLPPSLREDLARVVLTLDPVLIGAVIDRVMEIDPPLAEALNRCVKRSAYTEMLKALAACDIPSDAGAASRTDFRQDR